MRWYDEYLKEDEPRPTRRRALLGGAALVVGGLWLWRRGAHDVVLAPPPDLNSYRQVVDQIIESTFEGGALIHTVNASWPRLSEGEKNEAVVRLLDSTGSLDFERMEIRDQRGRLHAVIGQSGDVQWRTVVGD